MKTMKYLKLVAGSLVFAITCYAILAVPGFLSDKASTVSSHGQVGTMQP